MRRRLLVSLTNQSKNNCEVGLESTVSVYWPHPHPARETWWWRCTSHFCQQCHPQGQANKPLYLSNLVVPSSIKQKGPTIWWCNMVQQHSNVRAQRPLQFQISWCLKPAKSRYWHWANRRLTPKAPCAAHRQQQCTASVADYGRLPKVQTCPNRPCKSLQIACKCRVRSP